MTEDNNTDLVDLVDIEEAAKLTKRSVSQIRKLLAKGMFVPRVDVGANKHYFLKSDVDKWFSGKVQWGYNK